MLNGPGPSAVRFLGADTQADLGPDAGMEHGDGVPEAELCDAPEQEGGEAKEEGGPARQQHRPECHQGATPRVFGTTSATSFGQPGSIEECGTDGGRERRRDVHWDSSRVRARTPEFGTRPGPRLPRGHCESDAVRAPCRAPPLPTMPGRRPDLVPPDPVRPLDLGVSTGRPRVQVHLEGQDSPRPDGAGLRGKAVFGVSAVRTETGDLAGPRSLAVRPMWQPDTRERVVGGVPRFHDEWRLQSDEPCEPPGKFQTGGALTRERLQNFEAVTDDGWETLTALVDARLCYFWKFCGTKVPGTRNAVLKVPLQKRILFNIDEGQPNVIDIGYGTLPDYDLGTQEPIFVYVAQEFSGDFVQELKDVQFDPIEVTMDKGTKKALLESLDRICGPSFDEYLMACEDEHQNSEMTTDATGWCLPTAEERSYWIERAQECEEPRRWRRVGDNMVLCLLAGDEHFVPTVGPGFRHLRWTADLHRGQWSWREKGAQGQLHRPTQVPDTGTVVIYSTISPGVQEEFASYEELTTQEKKAILRAHVNLGHPSQSEFVRLLKAAGCRPDVISYVQREFSSCSGCDLEKRPPTRLPASTPRTYDFNVVVGVDVLFVHGLDNRTEHPVLNITCHGTLYSTFGLIDHTRRSAQLTFKAFDRLWLRTFGPPEFMILDQGTEFTGAAFQAGLERHCVQPLFIDQDAPFENGVTERRGGLFKNIYYRSRELAQPRDLDEVEALIFEVSWSLQTMCNRSGYSPAQRVLGRQPRVTLDMISDGQTYDLSTTTDTAWKRAEELRTAARKALIEQDSKERLARASRGRPRRQLENHVFREGQPVTVWRQGRRGALAKVGPCFVVCQQGHTIWVSRRAELWKCHSSQVFPMGPLECQGLEALPRDLLQAKERLRFDSEKLGYIDVTQENGDPPPGDAVASPLDGPGEPHVPQANQQLRPSSEGPHVPQANQQPRPSSEGPQVPQADQQRPSSGGPQVPQADQQRPSSGGPHVPQADQQRPSSGGPHVPQASVPVIDLEQESGSSSSGHPTVGSGALPEVWPPVAVKKWRRVDPRASRFRTSNSAGPMWSDVIRRTTKDLDSGRMIEDEQMTGTEPSRALHRTLPRGVTNIETTLYYRPRPGHPDPGISLDADDEPHQGGDDQRLFDRGLKRVHDGGGVSSARPKSKIGGVWVADCMTPWGDKARFPVIANARDLQLFGKLGVNDVLYTHSELHSGWVCLTRKSGKELQERSLNKEGRKLFDAAKLTEIQNLEGSNAISFITDPEEIEKIRMTMSHRLMPSRFILTKKQQEIGMAWKAKARWILLGHRDPDAQALERYAPTPATPTVYLAFQILSSLHYRLVIMDVSSAFGQSDAHEREQGPLFATMPPSGIPGKEKHHLIRVLTAVYGLVNAPAVWRKTVRKALCDLGYVESTFDPCLYVLQYVDSENPHGRRGCAGLVLLDVDDFLQGGNKRHESLMEQLRQRFKFGKWREIYGASGEYLGRTVSQKEDFEINISMRRYIEEKLSSVILPREKVKDEARPLDENETTLVRGAGGSLLWVGREARPDVAASCAMTMTWGKGGPTVQNIKFCNKVIQELQNTSEAYLRILPINLEDGIWLVFSDASLGNDGDKSQGGFMVAFCDRCIIDGKIARLSINSWKSHRLRRAVKASLGSEALALDDGLAELEWVKALFCEAVVPGTCVSDGTRYGADETIAVARMTDDGDPTIGVTDARALYDLYHRRSGAAGLCRRAQLDVAVMSKSAEVLRTKVFWIPGANMPADCLTKRLGNSSLMRWLMANAKYALTQGSLGMLWETPLDGCETKQHVPQSISNHVSG